MAVNILLLVLIVLRLIIGVRLFISARQNNLPNLNWLGAYFVAFAFGILFATVEGNPLGALPISLFLFIGVGVSLTQPALIVFNHVTFYQGRKSPVNWFWALFIITTIPTLYGVSLSDTGINQHPLVAAYIPTQLLIWGWHAWAAYQALQGVKQEAAVEDWIKSRYRLIVWYSILIIIGVVASLVRILGAGGGSVSPLGNAMALITLLMQIASVVLQFLVWVMPESFRQWLNRDQKKHTEERLHEQAQAVLNILGTSMSEGTGLSKMMALYSIRTVIGMQIKTEESAQVEARAVSMGLDEWTETLNHPELYILIKNSGGNVNPLELLNKAKQALIEKQSLFTMKAK